MSAGSGGSGGSGGSVGSGSVGATVSVTDTAPASPLDGALWLNSSTGDFNVYYTTANTWISIGGGTPPNSSVAITSNMFTGDGITANFEVGTGYSVDNLLIFDNGVTQTPGIDYTYTGTNVTFVSPPAVSSVIQIRKLGNSAIASGNLSISNLSDVNTITTAPVNGQALVWDSASGFWKPGSVSPGGIGEVGITVELFVGDGITANFSVGSGYSPETLIVFDNGVSQTPYIDFTYTGTQVTFITPPAASSSIQIRKLGNSTITSGNLSLNTLYDVNTISVAPLEGQALLWNSNSAKWIPGTVSSGAGGGVIASTSIFNGDGTTANFTVGTGYSVDNLIIFDNGVTQTPGVDYTYTGQNVTFITPPTLSSVIQVRKLAADTATTVSGTAWTITSINATLSVGYGYFVNTATQPITVTLPATASLGAIIRINDLAGTFNVNNLTIARNGNKIQGVDSNLVVTRQHASFGLIYSNSTYGWKLLEA